jgi:hypothetical protein
LIEEAIVEAELNGAKVISLGLFNQVITHTPTFNLLALLIFLKKMERKKIIICDTKNYFMIRFEILL